MKEKSVIGGAVAAAFLASLCCIGPLLFVVLGIGAFGAATVIESARPFLMGGAVLLLAIAFYWTYFRKGEACAPGEECSTKPASRASRIGLWVACMAVLIFAAMPYVAAPLAERFAQKKSPSEFPQEDCCVANGTGSAAPSVAPAAGMEKSIFKVTGMTCASCETTIKLALERTEGVRNAEVSYERGEAVVEYDPQKTGPDKLRQAIDETGYTCELSR
jgi:copper chaperone CopZ